MRRAASRLSCPWGNVILQDVAWIVDVTWIEVHAAVASQHLPSELLPEATIVWDHKLKVRRKIVDDESGLLLEEGP